MVGLSFRTAHKRNRSKERSLPWGLVALSRTRIPRKRSRRRHLSRPPSSRASISSMKDMLPERWRATMKNWCWCVKRMSWAIVYNCPSFTNLELDFPPEVWLPSRLLLSAAGRILLANGKETTHRACRLVLISGDKHVAQGTGMFFSLLSCREALLPYLPPQACTHALP